MADHTFFWHDYETFGRVPRRDRPCQFASVRTDAQLREIGEPLVQYCQPAPDYLPDPEACLLTGIVPQTCLEHGVPEHVFARAIEHQFAMPGTVGVGYNSIRFDDEVTRHLFWRNLIDPYAREWQNDCARWDLLHVVRTAWALRPDGLAWPTRDDGRPSFKLEDLTAANGVAHDSAHDALSDVRATLALARLVQARQPRLWEFCLRLRHKQEVVREMALAQSQGQPFLHVSGVYGVQRGCIALVWPLGPHPFNKNEVILWDLAGDPDLLRGLSAQQVRERLFVAEADLAPGTTRLPIKTLAINKSPVVVGNLKALTGDILARWSLDLPAATRHARALVEQTHDLAGLWPDVFARASRQEACDVDEDLYGGFVGPQDRRVLERLRTLDGHQLAGKHPVFADARLDELLFRYRARIFPGSLSAPEQVRWLDHCKRRLLDGQGGAAPLHAYLEQIDALGQDADERAQHILGALMDYATHLAPDRN